MLEAFDLTGSLRDAGELAGCSHHTVSRRGIGWPTPREAAQLLACLGAYRGPLAICTTSVATTLATTPTPACVRANDGSSPAETLNPALPHSIDDRIRRHGNTGRVGDSKTNRTQLGNGSVGR